MNKVVVGILEEITLGDCIVLKVGDCVVLKKLLLEIVEENKLKLNLQVYEVHVFCRELQKM